MCVYNHVFRKWVPDSTFTFFFLEYKIIDKEDIQIVFVWRHLPCPEHNKPASLTGLS